MPTKKLKSAGHIYERISADGRLTPIRSRFDTRVGDVKPFVRQVLGDHDRGHKIDGLISHRTTVADDIAANDSGKRKIKGAKEERYRSTRSSGTTPL